MTANPPTREKRILAKAMMVGSVGLAITGFVLMVTSERQLIGGVLLAAGVVDGAIAFVLSRQG